MRPGGRRELRGYASWGLYLAGLALLVSVGLYLVQRSWNTPLQVSLALVVIGLALFVMLDPDRVRRQFATRQARHGSNALIMILAFVGIIVVVNYLGFQNPKRWDLTEDRTNTLSEETINILEALPAEITARAFFTARLPTDTARDLLGDYEYFSQGKFTFEFIDPDADPLAARQANVTRDGTIVLALADRQEQVTLTTEREISAGLIRLLNDEERKVYFLTGHGEKDPDGAGNDSFSRARATLQQKNYQISKLNLLASPEVPQDAGVIVIAGPLQPLTAEEITLLEGFLSTGGSLVVMADPRPFTDFGEAADPLQEYLAEGWGVMLGEDVVVDVSTNQPLTAVANQYGDHLITQKMQGLVTFFPDARSVEITGAITGVTQIPLVLTAENAWAERNLDALESGQEVTPDPAEDLLGPVPMAVVADNFETGSRLVVFGDSNFASDARYDAFGNGDLFINAVDWAAEEEDLINLTPRQQTSRILIPPDATTLNLIFLVLVFLLPGVVVVAGGALWWRRRRSE